MIMRSLEVCGTQHVLPGCRIVGGLLHRHGGVVDGVGSSRSAVSRHNRLPVEAVGSIVVDARAVCTSVYTLRHSVLTVPAHCAPTAA